MQSQNPSLTFKKSDFLAALIVGEAVAWLVLAIIKNIKLPLPYLWSLPIVFPILAVVGLYICYLISKIAPVFFQIGKYILVGFLNTFLDWGILNLLIFLSGVATGIFYSVFKTISFLFSMANSYFWNKFWTFKKKPIQGTAPSQKKTPVEFLQFFVISLVGVLLNVSIASLVVNLIGVQFGLTEAIWANVGAFFGTLVSMIWNFVGYKFIVFKT